MTKQRFATCRGGVFAVEEEATGKLWGLSAEAKYAEEKAGRIARTMGRNMCVCHYNKDNVRTVVTHVVIAQNWEEE